jgi:HEPN domain-containing protein
MEIKLVREWFYLAEADIDSAKLLKEMRPQHREIICYHCEQSAEKYLKGYLQSRDIMPPKTHELTNLRMLCIEIDANFNEISSECAYLTQFGVQPRYPNVMDFTDFHVERALVCAEKIKNFAPIVALRQVLTENG